MTRDNPLDLLSATEQDRLRDCDQPGWTSPFPDDHPEDDAITWDTPKLVTEFRFTGWARAGKLRHPRFLGLRRDEAARDVARESPEPAS